MCQQRQRRHEEEGKRCEQSQPIGGLHLLHVEYALERREDERAGHESRHVGVKDDQDTPMQLELVRVDVPLHRSAHLAV